MRRISLDWMSLLMLPRRARFAAILLLMPLGLLLMPLGMQAQEMLVTAEWLQSRLQDPEVAILHVGSQADYAEGHIPGARLVRLEDISITGPENLRLQLPRVDALVEAFQKLGVTDTNRVVLYRSTGALQSVTRAWFTLDYLGLGERSAILDGGLGVWKSQGLPVSKDAVPPANTRFAAHSRPARVASAEWIRMHRGDPSVMLVDARLPEFYSGADKGAMPRGGHIPGATNIPFVSFFDDAGRFKARPELKALLRAGAVGPEPVRVTYCHIGQQATVPYFVGRLLGLDVRVFDGSFQEWSQRKEFPVETAGPAN